MGQREGAARHLPSAGRGGDRKSTRLNSSHLVISYAVFCLKKKTKFFSSFSPLLRYVRLLPSPPSPPPATCRSSPLLFPPARPWPPQGSPPLAPQSRRAVPR